MKIIIVILAFAAVSALLTGCWVEKEKLFEGVEKVVDGVKKVVVGVVEVVVGVVKVVIGVVEVVDSFFFTVNLSELEIRSDDYGDVYVDRKTLEPYSGKFKNTYGNGVTKETGTLKDGRRHGKITTYREDGSIEKIETFPNELEYLKYLWRNRKRMLGSFVDQRNSNEYKTVTIGSQIWMAENLNYAVEGSVCYDNKAENCTKYGLLYDWNTAKNACPAGWHLPSQAEWEEMTAYIGGWDAAEKKLKARSGWNNKSDGSSGNGTDEFGLAALPGGDKGSSKSNFGGIGDSGYW
jgi:uncharacterized protein (TIGR02145 family)